MRMRILALLATAVVIPACGSSDTTEDNTPFLPDVVFKANPTTANRYDVFAANLKGTKLLNLSKLPGASMLTIVLWSPDRNWVAYIADGDTPGVMELYVVPPDGSEPPQKVSGPMTAGGGVAEFAWAPNSQRLAYRADQDTDDVFELYTVRPTGGGRVKISGPMTPGGNATAQQFAFSPNSTRVAYLADQLVDGRSELFVSAADGSGSVRVSKTIVAVGGQIGEFAWAPNSSRVAYRGDADTAAKFELYTVLPDGTANVTVSGAINVVGGGVGAIAWAPDSSRIAYAAIQDTATVTELYTSLPAGGGNAKVCAPLPAGRQVDLGWAWAPDSSRIAYVADQDTDDIPELFTGLPDGSGNTKVSGALAAGRGVRLFNVRWSPDSSRVAYEADQDIDDQYDLYTSLAAGGGNVKVSNLLPTEKVQDQDYYWSPDSTRLAYQSVNVDLAFNQTLRLRTALAAGGGETLLNTASSIFPQWTDDSEKVVFVSQDQVEVSIGVFVPGPAQVVVVNTDGSDGRVISGPTVPTGHHGIFIFQVR